MNPTTLLASVLIPFCVWMNCEVPFDITPNQPVITDTKTTPKPVVQADISQSSLTHKKGADVEQWRPLVAGHFEPEDVERVLCIMSWESLGNPDIRNKSSGASGLMQVMPFWAGEYDLAVSDLFTPEINLYVARKIRDQQGWKAWSPYNRGECR